MALSDNNFAEELSFDNSTEYLQLGNYFYD